MTRINLVDPKELSNQHLLAELRELPRIFAHVKKYGVSKNIPEKFTLGKGHILFFTNKLSFLISRYGLLIYEWKYRGFNWSYDFGYFIGNNYEICNEPNQIEWQPTEKDIELSRVRINEKIAMKPDWYKYSNTKISETKEDKFYQHKADMAYEEYKNE